MSGASVHSVRRAVAADVPGCAAVLNHWIDSTDWFPRLMAPEVYEGYIAEAFPLREIWVSGDPIEGYVSVHPEAGKIGAIYCRTTGKGLGRAFMDAAKAGRDALWLHVHLVNERARRFYAREGFVEAGYVGCEPPEMVPVMRMEWTR